MPAAQDDPSSRPLPRRQKVEVDCGATNVRVTLSLPAAGTARPNRKKVLERARRMLAAALEEEQRGTDRPPETVSNAPKTVSPAPGNGAWWLF